MRARLYAAIRRLELLDVTKLLVGKVDRTKAIPGAMEVYQFHCPSAAELTTLVAGGFATSAIGSPTWIQSGQRHVVIAKASNNSSGSAQPVVGYVWFATADVLPADNFSRSPKLGTGFKLPPDAAFIFNAWTDPTHRGRGLLAAMVRHALSERLSAVSTIVTTADWTNRASLAAFAKIGMNDLGEIYRVRIGRRQFIHIPGAAAEINLVATTSP